MSLNNNDWREIQKYVEGRLAEQGEYFTQAVVIKRDDVNKLIWCREFGDIAIPLFTFDVEVKYYYRDGTGNMVPRKTRLNEANVITPKVGDVVLIARLLGSAGLPRCIGTLKSTNVTGGD